MGRLQELRSLACGLVDGLKETIGGDNLKAAMVLSGYSEGLVLLGEMGQTPNRFRTSWNWGSLRHRNEPEEQEQDPRGDARFRNESGGGP